MAKIAKTARRALKRAASSGRTTLRERTPDWLKRPLAPVATHLDMLFIDHGIFRMAYLNLHKLGQDTWRAAQPAPHHFARFKRMGIKTVVNLRGERDCGSYWLERQACARLGLEMVNYQVRSRAAPTPEEVLGARDLFERISYPMVMHCKSGADRAGLMSVLFLHFREGLPIEEAKAGLSLRYGHIRQADTGILDAFFERYLADTREAPKAFEDWLVEDYDPAELLATFRADGWANRLVNSILRRE